MRLVFSFRCRKTGGRWWKPISLVLAICALGICVRVRAAELDVELGNAEGVTLVGAMQRWDANGNHRRLPDARANIAAPAVDATAVDTGNGRWIFKDVAKGTYDLVILADGRRRYEGFQFVPVREFDRFFQPDMGIKEETRDAILEIIGQSPQYENIVKPLCLVGDSETVRVLMMLVRDKPTTYGDVANAASIRHEIWQFSWKHGGWQKEKRTKVMDRILMDRNELRKWTWLWDPKLGGIVVGDRPATVRYALPPLAGEKKPEGPDAD
jgi:hypothetical protein